MMLIMNLPFTLIVLFVGSVSAAGPAWSPACETKNSGLYTPQNINVHPLATEVLVSMERLGNLRYKS
jgi:hypothetical protein